MSADVVRVLPWEEEQSPNEETVRRLLSAEGLQAYRWSNGPGDVYSAHAHPFHKVIYVLRGTISFGLPDEGRSVVLQAGDRLELPAGVTHDAVVGSAGVVCLEAHR